MISGTPAILTCTVLASDVGNAINWNTRNGWISSSDSKYTVSTQLATNVEVDGVTRKSISTLKISNFDSVDASHSYQCKVDYSSPFLDEQSNTVSINVIGKTLSCIVL